jgi:hypothetical protein
VFSSGPILRRFSSNGMWKMGAAPGRESFRTLRANAL